MTTTVSPMTAESPQSRVLRHFPGGSNGEFRLPADLVPVLREGRGCRVRDVLGRSYLDMSMAWGSALVGHAHPRVVEAATRQAALGANFAAINERSLELAERIRDLSPCAEKIRFVASGTEATMLCLRVARNATGRSKILRFEGAYHGQHPVGVAGMLAGRNGDLPRVDPRGAGEPGIEEQVLVAPFNDLAATDRIMADHADRLAAVIVEPLHRCLPPAPGFLAGLRESTRRHGIVLIFDEVVTGFRLALGGAQEFYGVQPDLVAYGKALGGGFPIGAFAGASDLMEAVNEHRIAEPDYVWSASTTGGNPVSCAAALAVLEVLSEPGVYPRLRSLGKQLRDRMGTVLNGAGQPAQILGDGPLAQFAFTDQPIRDHQGWQAADQTRGRSVMLGLVERGVFLNPMGTKLYLSLAHDEAVIEEFAGLLEECVAQQEQPGVAG
jgi:glutamate-1-semialdehyde 2,1-aminomutase